MQSRIMYLEAKDGGVRCSVEGGARIGRVSFSKTGRTLYYRGAAFRSLGGRGYKANSVDVASRAYLYFWISGCRGDGRDSLYAAIVEIDEDVREEYWRDVRGLPERSRERSFRSPGKHTTSGPVDGGRDGAERPRRRRSR